MSSTGNPTSSDAGEGNTNLLDRISKLEASYTKLLGSCGDLALNNRQLKYEIDKLKIENSSLHEDIYNLENNVSRLDQYGRRENLEIVNLPESLTQKDLEPKILQILKSMKFDISSYDIVGVHRIGKKRGNRPRNVIIRFVNRKDAHDMISYSKTFSKKASDLGYKNVFITENLCPVNRKIFNRCYKLKKEGTIKNVWTYNGSVNVKLIDSDIGEVINHFDDIDTYVFGEDLSTNSASTLFNTFDIANTDSDSPTNPINTSVNINSNLNNNNINNNVEG